MGLRTQTGPNFGQKLNRIRDIHPEGGYSIVWKSKTQGDSATSTIESEYNALRMSLRDVLSLLVPTKIIMNAS
jgi:hypothetical protein